MKNVIRNFVVMAVMSALTVSAFAQGAGPGGGKGQAGGGKPGQGGPGGPGGGMRRGPGMMMGMDSEILAKLKLTKPQMDAVKKVKEDTKKKMDALRGSMPKPAAGGERPKMDPGMREKFKSLMDGYQAGMKKAMGDAKFAEYQKMMKAAMDKMREKGGFGGGRPGGPGAAGGPGAGKGKGGGNKPGL